MDFQLKIRLAFMEYSLTTIFFQIIILLYDRRTMEETGLTLNETDCKWKMITIGVVNQVDPSSYARICSDFLINIDIIICFE